MPLDVSKKKKSTTLKAVTATAKAAPFTDLNASNDESAIIDGEQQANMLANYTPAEQKAAAELDIVLKSCNACGKMQWCLLDEYQQHRPVPHVMRRVWIHDLVSSRP
jgi:hypothetical protein